LRGCLSYLYQHPGVAETVDIGYIKRHRYGSHESINPTRVVPNVAIMDFAASHHDPGRLAG
jgi:glutathionyl-hydroquinone reductase